MDRLDPEAVTTDVEESATREREGCATAAVDEEKSKRELRREAGKAQCPARAFDELVTNVTSLIPAAAQFTSSCRSATLPSAKAAVDKFEETLSRRFRR